jgi:hypothetical protein
MGMIRILDDSFKATTDMSALQFAPVKLGAKGFVAVLAAATDPVFGILLSKPRANDSAEVAIFGRYPALVDGSGTPIAIQDLLGPNAAGTMLVKKATADNNVCARALDVCTISGGVIDVLLFGGIGAVFRTLT